MNLLISSLHSYMLFHGLLMSRTLVLTLEKGLLCLLCLDMTGGTSGLTSGDQEPVSGSIELLKSVIGYI